MTVVITTQRLRKKLNATKRKECRKKKFPLSPPGVLWTPFSSLRTTDPLSTYLRTNSLISIQKSIVFLYIGRKAVINLENMLKWRDITLPTKVCIAKSMVFPLVMYRCESWAMKKTELWRTDVFKMWRWRRLLRVPWAARRSNQWILKEISFEC